MNNTDIQRVAKALCAKYGDECIEWLRVTADGAPRGTTVLLEAALLAARADERREMDLMLASIVDALNNETRNLFPFHEDLSTVKNAARALGDAAVMIQMENARMKDEIMKNNQLLEAYRDDSGN